MKPKTFQLPETTIELLSIASDKAKEPKQVIVNKAILKYIKDKKIIFYR
jgi:hypothetical protein